VRVFLAGATGAIGRELLPRLVAAGHEVTGTTRSEQRAIGLRASGADAAVVDALDEAAMRAAVEAARPEVVVHQLTSLPRRREPRGPKGMEATNRLRSEGTRILVAAAESAGARRMVAQSVAFLYEPTGEWVKSEDAPLASAGGTGTTIASHEALVMAGALEGVVLRYGWLYGPGTYYAPDGSTTEDVRRRRFPVVGRGQGRFSFVHVADAADATVAAIERGGPGAYNVVDDEPAPMREWLPVFAEAAGAKRPLTVPKLVARLAAGRAAAESATAMRGASNAKARRELGWTPRHPSWRQGFPESFA